MARRSPSGANCFHIGQERMDYPLKTTPAKNQSDLQEAAQRRHELLKLIVMNPMACIFEG
jgi:hypothetical protein